MHFISVIWEPISLNQHCPSPLGNDYYFIIEVLWVIIVCHVPKVLGAALFYAKVGDSAILYTGDYNMTPDRHLGAAQVDRLDLDLVITEYGMCICVF